MVLLEELEGSQRLDTGCSLGGIGEFPSGESVLVDGNGGVGCLRGVRGGFRMIMRL